jgi:tetratricopeptide (TPR) repeat protein
MKYCNILLLFISIGLNAQSDQLDEEKTFPSLNSGIVYSQSSEELLKEAINHFDGKRFELSLDYLQQAIKVNKNSELSDILFYYQSLTYLKLNRIDASTASVDQAINLNSNKINYYLLRAELLIQKGELSKADNDISIILEKESKNEWALLHKAILQQKKGMLKEAVQSYNFLINQNNKHAQAYFCRGMLMLEAGVADKGCEDLKTAETLGFEDAKIQRLRYCR